MDIIDPVLASSVQRKRIDSENFTRLFYIIIVLILLILVGWIVYSTTTSRIDTKAEETINVDDRINNIQFEGRLDPIQDTR